MVLQGKHDTLLLCCCADAPGAATSKSAPAADDDDFADFEDFQEPGQDLQVMAAATG